MNAPLRHGPDGDIFNAMVDALAPDKGDAVALIESYFDESFDDAFLCVGGYIFKNTKAKQFNKDWKKMLLRYQLPYFRMSACNSGNDPFDHLSKDECIAAQTEAIALINKYAAAGYAVTLDKKAFDEIISEKGVVSSAYELCVWMCLLGVHRWLEQENIPRGVAYFFEAGHEHQTKANALMNRIFNEYGLREFYRYKAHAFVDKQMSRPVQAADILVWQRFKTIQRQKKGIFRLRADCAALITGTKTFIFDANRAKIQELADKVNAKFGSQELARIFLTASAQEIAAAGIHLGRRL